MLTGRGTYIRVKADKTFPNAIPEVIKIGMPEYMIRYPNF